MRRLVLLTSLAAAACGGDPGATLPSRQIALEGGATDLRQCDVAQPRPLPGKSCSTAGAPATLALGVCGDLETEDSGALTVRSPSRGALVAVNGKTITASPLTVQGALISLGTIDARHTQLIEGNIATASDWMVWSPVRTSGDVFVGGVVDATNTVTIDGTLHVADPTSAYGVEAGRVAIENVQVSAPLACSRAPRADATADAILAASKGDWIDLTTADASLDLVLGCATYRLDAPSTTAPLTLRIEGHVTLVIDGDWTIGAPTTIALEPGATLALIVRGSIVAKERLVIAGEPKQTWMAVGGGMHVAAPVELQGALVMPDGELRVEDELLLSGQALVGHASLAAPTLVRLDQPRDDLTCGAGQWDPCPAGF